MKLKTLTVLGSILALGACYDNNTQNPEMLRGANFVTKSGETEITLGFAPDEMRVHGQVINMYNASYQASGNKISFGDVASTMMMGPDTDMQVEYEYFQFLSTVQSYNLKDGKLTLNGADGKTVTFTQVQSDADDNNVAADVVVTETQDTVIETESVDAPDATQTAPAPSVE